MPFRIADVGRNVAVQCASDRRIATEVDVHDRHGTNGLPSRLKIAIDVRSDGWVGEQHGSRQTSIRSAEFIVEFSEQLEEEDRLA